MFAHVATAISTSFQLLWLRRGATIKRPLRGHAGREIVIFSKLADFLFSLALLSLTIDPS